MSYWMLAHSDELLIDLDDFMRPAKSGGPWGEVFFRRRLREAMRAGKLAVREVWLVRSSSPHHFQIIVRLKKALPLMERLVWQLHLGSDLYRGRADLMRAAKGIKAPSLLILPEPIPGFYREPDRVCECVKKHVTAENPACAVWRELRGMSPWELFGPSSQEKEGCVALPLGRVPLELILRKEKVNGV